MSSNSTTDVGLEGENDGETAKTTSLGDVDIETADVDVLLSENYTSSIENVNRISDHLDNLSEASAYLQRVESAVDSLKSETRISELSELDDTIQDRYVELGRVIFNKLDDEEVLFIESDEPETLTSDFEDYCESVTTEYNRCTDLNDAREKLSGYKSDLSEYDSGDADTALEIYKNSKEKLEKAIHFIGLQGGECSHCGVRWENISTDRRQEIEDKLNEYKEEFQNPGEDFDEESAEDAKSDIESDIATLQRLKRNIEEEEDNVTRLESQSVDNLETLCGRHLSS
ncbi:hypothetical protein OB919_08040 [Halobacteria archaeon AArc-curdl1]|uniref:Uncharacterized protein n=1 Tax=Natronosalvus hydrolyticus TaxID=2979988 RepID=A0AAP3E6K7_9EURY|nr:hypothetical protein [Halobacteria archaeon AArc-curdl1]